MDLPEKEVIVISDTEIDSNDEWENDVPTEIDLTWTDFKWNDYFTTSANAISPLSEEPHAPLTWKKPLFLTAGQIHRSAKVALRFATASKPPLTWHGAIYVNVLFIGVVVGVRYRPKGYQCFCTTFLLFH